MVDEFPFQVHPRRRQSRRLRRHRKHAISGDAKFSHLLSVFPVRHGKRGILATFDYWRQVPGYAMNYMVSLTPTHPAYGADADTQGASGPTCRPVNGTNVTFTSKDVIDWQAGSWYRLNQITRPTDARNFSRMRIYFIFNKAYKGLNWPKRALLSHGAAAPPQAPDSHKRNGSLHIGHQRPEHIRRVPARYLSAM